MTRMTVRARSPGDLTLPGPARNLTPIDVPPAHRGHAAHLEAIPQCRGQVDPGAAALDARCVVADLVYVPLITPLPGLRPGSGRGLPRKARRWRSAAGQEVRSSGRSTARAVPRLPGVAPAQI